MTVVWLTAGLFHQVAETDIDALATVPVLMSGGDVLNPDAVRAVLAARRGRPLVAGYGREELAHRHHIGRNNATMPSPKAAETANRRASFWVDRNPTIATA